MSGWIKIHRDLMNHWCASDPNFLAVWMHLISSANFQTKKSLINSIVVEVKRGQLIFGLNAFSKKSGVSVSKLRRIMKVLESELMISRQKTNKYSIISITKYNDYQVIDKQNTGKKQSNNNQNTTPKEGKEGKEGKEVSYDDLFDEFWKAYPKRQGSNPKAPAKKKFLKRCNDGISPDDIISGAKKYANQEVGTKERKYIAQATTWLNQERWNDEYARPKKQHKELCEDFGVEETDEIVTTVLKFGKAKE